MASSKTILFFCIIATCVIGLSLANPVPQFGDFDFLGVCIRNCAQCKKMFGPYFEGELCAESCVKFKGKVIPDCQDAASIESFLTKYE